MNRPPVGEADAALVKGAGLGFVSISKPGEVRSVVLTPDTAEATAPPRYKYRASLGPNLTSGGPCSALIDFRKAAEP